MFRYIASELAQMTFEEYVEKKRNGDFKDLNDITLLRQVSEGLSYLHSQGIIHCNIRPENVLISTPMRPKGDRKAMITDCNLSKTIPLKKISSIARADGWIAPEVLHSHEDTFEPQTVNDIFTLGCLFFYVLKDGHHPFGDQYHRLANVYDGNSNIDMLKNEESLCLYNLISAMIDNDPAMRPSIEAVIKHPIFWDSKTLLEFIGHVSNRIVQEHKDNKDSSLLKILESRASDVTKNDWISIITQDLRKDIESRSYDGSLVKDLLCVIRNKQQHYDELLENVKLSLGPLPDKFASYFTQRFPLLLVHTYMVQYCKTENNFKDYYCDSFDFPTLPVI
jgi:serine/threonine-protein kinase/endoribonuclease IRE1